MYHLLVQCQPDSRVNAIISRMRIRQSYQTRATDRCHLWLSSKSLGPCLFWSKQVDPKQIIYLSWMTKVFLRCTFVTAILAIDHRSSLSSLSTLDLFPTDFFPLESIQSDASMECPIGVLSEWEFQASFHISHNIPIQLTNDEALSSRSFEFNLSAHISSLQLVTDLPNPCKYWAKGHVLVSSPWNGSSVSPNEVFLHNAFLFKIDTIEQAYKVLLSDKNLLALTEYP
ncbi:hypothetical protein AAG906_022059 [Vitis piasezkii]